MNDKIRHRVVEILQDRGYSARIMQGYSGRGMFGKEVPAIVTDASGVALGMALMQACIEQGEDDPEFLVDEALDLAWDEGKLRQDSMGRSETVWY